jgi:predicted nucleic acid-binding protein
MTEYLIDTNILIYYLAGALTPEEKPTVDKILKDSFNISIITKIELLGWKDHTPEGLIKARHLLDCARCLPLTETLAEKTIEMQIRHPTHFEKLVHMCVSVNCQDDFTSMRRQ